MLIFGHPFFGLSIEKSKLSSIFSYFDFWGHFSRENGRGHQEGPECYGASKPNQKAGQVGGPFGSTAFLKTCYQIFMA